MPIAKLTVINPTIRFGLEFEAWFFGPSSKDVITKHEQNIPVVKSKRFAALNVICNPALQLSLYSWDPRDPWTIDARRLFLAVQESLPPKKANTLQMHCLLGTTIDFKYGADFVLRVGTKQVFVDLTINPKKIKRSKVLILSKEILQEGNEDQFKKFIRDVLLAFGIKIKTTAL